MGTGTQDVRDVKTRGLEHVGRERVGIRGRAGIWGCERYGLEDLINKQS